MELPPTDDKIREYVYSNVYQEYSDEVTGFIKGMIHMRDLWIKSLNKENNEQDINNGD